jgi:hypothetical protein
VAFYELPSQIVCECGFLVLFEERDRPLAKALKDGVFTFSCENRRCPAYGIKHRIKLEPLEDDGKT